MSVGGFSPKRDWMLGEEEAWNASHGGTGSAQTLPMSDEEREQAAKRKRPLGFTAELPKTRKRRKAT